MTITTTTVVAPPMLLRRALPAIMAIAMGIATIIGAHAEGSPLERGAFMIPAPETANGGIDSSSLLHLPPDAQATMLAWVGVESARMPKSVPPVLQTALLQTIWYEARRSGLEPSTVLAVVDVASGFRKYFIGTADTRGYMAVAPHWVREVGDGKVDKLFVMQVNLRYGCTILRHDIDVARGDLGVALQLYQVQQAPDLNRPRSSQALSFANDVFAARRRWLTDDEKAATTRSR